jgi:hypothetical protein
VELLINDLSLQGQFQDLTTFKGAIERILAIRKIARRFGRSLHCHRALAYAQVTSTMTMPQAVQALAIDERRALMQWLTQYGPFWEDTRNHQPDDWFDWNDSIVTDTAVGEAAWCCLNGMERNLVSFSPSDWQFSPIPVSQMTEAGIKEKVDILNFWDVANVEAVLQTAPVPLASWEQLAQVVSARCNQLFFTEDAFTHLVGHPFAYSAAQRLIFILDTLNRFKTCFDDEGQRTIEGHQIYRDFFTGKKGDGGRGALFSDSSEDEKVRFEAKLTFRHPNDHGKSLFCPWHGKVQTPQLRVHFSSPICADEPLYVVYVGPKITIR